MRYFKLLKDYESPFKKICKDVVKEAKEWIEEFVSFPEGWTTDSDIEELQAKTDWLVEVFKCDGCGEFEGKLFLNTDIGKLLHYCGKCTLTTNNLAESINNASVPSEALRGEKPDDTEFLKKLIKNYILNISVKKIHKSLFNEVPTIRFVNQLVSEEYEVWHSEIWVGSICVHRVTFSLPHVHSQKEIDDAEKSCVERLLFQIFEYGVIVEYGKALKRIESKEDENLVEKLNEAKHDNELLKQTIVRITGKGLTRYIYTTSEVFNGLREDTGYTEIRGFNYPNNDFMYRIKIMLYE